jgi:preprotein translocase subunit SecF
MLFGIVIGTNSSIFVAAPITYELYSKKKKEIDEKTEEAKS